MKKVGTRKKRAIAKCTRNYRNWAGPITKKDLFDHENFDAHEDDENRKQLQLQAPKLWTLTETIRRLDAKDQTKYGKHFKHFIFSNTQGKYGAKIIASALRRFLRMDSIIEYAHPHHGRSARLVIKEGGANHFALMTKSTLFGLGYDATFHDRLLKRFNADDNTYGEKCRIMLMDSSNKEGVSLHDVKYVHLFEEFDTYAQQKQAVARAIRYCSHKRLPFTPGEGWKVHVHMYRLVLRPNSEGMTYKVLDKDGTYKDLSASNQFVDTNLKQLNMSANEEFNEKWVNFFQAAAPALAVDFGLTRPIHPLPNKAEFGDDQLHGVLTKMFRFNGEPTFSSTSKKLCEDKRTRILREPPDPTKQHTLNQMVSYVETKYAAYKVKKPDVVENKCEGAEVLTPFQQYMADYFSTSKFHGMLLWHNPGSGKTCAAINMVDTLYKGGYTKVFWITSSQLGKKKIECKLNHLTRKELKGPKTMRDDDVHIAGSEVLTYVNAANRLGDLKRLHHAVLVIDEAHLMFNDDLPPREKPNESHLEKLYKRITDAWAETTTHPLRVILLTGTPVPRTPLAFFRMMNFIRDRRQPMLPETQKEVVAKYGKFPTERTKFTQLRNDLAGYISYLDISTDPTHFAQRTQTHFHDVPMTAFEEGTRPAQEEYKKSLKKFKKQQNEVNKTIREFASKSRQPSNTAHKLAIVEEFPRKIKELSFHYLDDYKEKEKRKKEFGEKHIKLNLSQQSWLSNKKCKYMKIYDDQGKEVVALKKKKRGDDDDEEEEEEEDEEEEEEEEDDEEEEEEDDEEEEEEEEDEEEDEEEEDE